jgi:hypothetical protein
MIGDERTTRGPARSSGPIPMSTRCNQNQCNLFALFAYTSRALSLTKIPAVLPSELLHELSTMAYCGPMTNTSGTNASELKEESSSRHEPSFAGNDRLP